MIRESDTRQEITSIDNDVRGKYNQYNTSKTTLTNLQKRQTGNLATKSLVSIVPPSALVRDSEYLETHLVAVPKNQARDFPRMYETLSQWVVPRSGQQIESDDEFTLFSVTTFKKYSQEFIHKAREQKWIPRDYKFEEGGSEAERKELDRVGREEKQLWSEALMLGRTGWGEAVAAWAHVLALQVFVETVLRYGLPLSFVCGLLEVSMTGPFDNLYNADCCRQTRRRSRTYETASISSMDTLEAMLCHETRRATSRRIRRPTPRCRWLAGVVTASTQRMSATSLRSYRQHLHE